MNTKPPYKMQLHLKLLLLALISSGCQTLITEKDFYAFQGNECIETHYIGTGFALLTADACTDILLAKPETTDPTTGVVIPGHGAGIFMSAATFSEFKKEHEDMCRSLGKECTLGVGNNSTPTPSPGNEVLTGKAAFDALPFNNLPETRPILIIGQ